jgi:Flp pilus assembly protein protease CpaA
MIVGRELMLKAMVTVPAISLLVFAGYGDWRSRRIANELCLAIVVLGLARLILTGDPVAASYTVGAAVGVFASGFILFAFGVFGGGDAKLLAATTLLVGYHDLLGFLVAMSLFGAILGIFALARAWFGPWLDLAQIGLSVSFARFAPANYPEGKLGSWLRRIPKRAPDVSGGAKAARPTVPYGLAITAAAIVVLILQANSFG